MARAAPDRLIAAKHGAGSVVVGLGRGEMFIASDIPAILAHTRDVVILEDGEVAVVTAGGGCRHFMLKEIYEQPRAITDTFRGRIAPETGSIVLPDVTLDPVTARAIDQPRNLANSVDCGIAAFPSGKDHPGVAGTRTCGAGRRVHRQRPAYRT